MFSSCVSGSIWWLMGSILSLLSKSFSIGLRRESTPRCSDAQNGTRRAWEPIRKRLGFVMEEAVALGFPLPKKSDHHRLASSPAPRLALAPKKTSGCRPPRNSPNDPHKSHKPPLTWSRLSSLALSSESESITTRPFRFFTFTMISCRG